MFKPKEASIFVRVWVVPVMAHPHSGRTTQKKKFTLGAWNVRTLLDRAGTLRPERRTALVAKELQRYRIEIPALSETRLADEGSLKEEGGGYTFFWKGKPLAEDRIHGVGFAIRITLLKNTPALPVAINERLMKVRIPLSKIRYLTVVSAYAPTLTSPDETKEQFYDQFDQVIRSTPPSDKLIIFGDFNARVGKGHNSWEGILGRHGVGKINDNGLLLLSKCAQHSLCITNTFFRMADKYKTTWMQPRSKHWHMIDFVIVRQRDIRDVRLTRAMRVAECWTDHRLVRTVLSLHIAPLHRKQPKTVRASYNVASLGNPFRLSKFQEVLDGKLQNDQPLDTSSEKWTFFRDTITEVAKEVLGEKTSTHEDWFDEKDEKIKDALYIKNKAFIEWQNDPSSVSKRDKFKTLQAKVQSELRHMQDKWWEVKAAQVQLYADTHNANKFFSSLKTVFGPSASGCSPYCPQMGQP
ncbi:craniofacial development protein 2-like [Montipora capricornis]|uniref:craniofacial development protein 2-like n=1 Tax=Montipora capricornis TaxID=246305 RepID=UPI0035F1644A